MVKRRGADEVLAQAAQNGYERGAHEMTDQKRGQGKHCATTKSDHERTLDRYVILHIGQYKATGLPPPTEEDARAECLGKGVAAPDLVKIKDFLRFYIATSTPQIADKSTTESIVSVAEWFFPALSNATGTETSKDDRSEIFSWIRRVLVAEGLVVNIRRPKHNFTVSDLDRVLRTLWTEDDVGWIPERYRVQFTFILHVFCWTGARLGAFFKGGLLYEDVEIVLQRTDGDQWSAIYILKQRWVKGNRDPENIVFGAASKEHVRLLYNETALLLAMAIADGALVGIKTLRDLHEQRLYAGENYRVLRFSDETLKRPILRRCTKSGGTLEEKMPERTFLDIFKTTMMNAGYRCRTSVHAIRRGLWKKVDEKYTPVQRSQHLTQGDTRVFGQSYVANCSSVDGQAAFHGMTSDHRHIEYFQGLEKFREQGLPTELPANEVAKLEEDDQLQDLMRQLDIVDGEDEDALKSTKIKIKHHRRKLQRRALDKYQEEWIRKRRDWKVEARGRTLPEHASKTDLFDNTCQLIPERRRLAVWMSSADPLKAHDKWQAISDLCTLCTPDPAIYYLPQLHPIAGACPVQSCGTQLSTIINDKRSQHIRQCTQRDMANRLCRLQSEIHYCYLCYEWVVGDDWGPHCRQHLAALDSKRCGSYTACYTLVRPAYCPFCLGDFTLSPTSRLRSWARDHSLWKHICDHLRTVNWPLRCPHPLCNSTISDVEALGFHFIDHHDISKTRPDSGSTTCAPKDMEIQIVLTTAETMLQSDRPLKKQRMALTVAPYELSLTRGQNQAPLDGLVLEERKTSEQSLHMEDDAFMSQFIRFPSPEAKIIDDGYGDENSGTKHDSPVGSPQAHSKLGLSTNTSSTTGEDSHSTLSSTRSKLRISLRVGKPARITLRCSRKRSKVGISSRPKR